MINLALAIGGPAGSGRPQVAEHGHGNGACLTLSYCSQYVLHLYDQGDQVEAVGYRSVSPHYLLVRYPGGLGWAPQADMDLPEDYTDLLPVADWGPEHTDPYHNVLYTPNDHLDVRLPETDSGPYPTVLLLHGLAVTKEPLYAAADTLVAHGYATVLPNLQHTWRDDLSNLSNTFCALAWLHTNAEEHGFDPGRVAVLGHSAGGHGAVLLGAVDDASEFMEDCPHQLPESNWVQAVMAYGGALGTEQQHLPSILVKSLSTEDRAIVRETLWDTPYEDWPEISGLSEAGTSLLHALPFYWVDGSEPPFLFIYGELDEAELPEDFVHRLQAVGVEAGITIIPDAGHGDIMSVAMPGFQAACEAATAFLDEVFDL